MSTGTELCLASKLCLSNACDIEMKMFAVSEVCCTFANKALYTIPSKSEAYKSCRPIAGLQPKSACHGPAKPSCASTLFVLSCKHSAVHLRLQHPTLCEAFTNFAAAADCHHLLLQVITMRRSGFFACQVAPRCIATLLTQPDWCVKMAAFAAECVLTYQAVKIVVC